MNKHISFGLMRIFGSIAFISLGLLSFYKGNEWFGVGIDVDKVMLAEFGWKVTVLLLVSIIIGLVGLLLGQGIGASIPVRNDRVCWWIDTLWHFVANTSIIWFFATMVVMGISLGNDGSKKVVTSAGSWQFAILIAAIAALTALGMVFQLYVVVELFARHGMRDFASTLSKLFPPATCITVAVLQSLMLGVHVAWGVLMGFLVPFIIVPMSMSMRDRDQMRRMKHTLQSMR
ncbi:MAG: hypothetical protein DRO99_02180, partial [Candidatus Aenigmatarchaeota archaeon]